MVDDDDEEIKSIFNMLSIKVFPEVERFQI
jgi:hypothetical protein